MKNRSKFECVYAGPDMFDRPAKVEKTEDSSEYPNNYTEPVPKDRDYEIEEVYAGPGMTDELGDEPEYPRNFSKPDRPPMGRVYAGPEVKSGFSDPRDASGELPRTEKEPMAVSVYAVPRLLGEKKRAKTGFLGLLNGESLADAAKKNRKKHKRNLEPTPEERPVPRGTSGKLNFCPNCGAKLEGEPVFCPDCGAEIREVLRGETDPMRPKAAQSAPNDGVDDRTAQMQGVYAGPATIGRADFDPRYVSHMMMVYAGPTYAGPQVPNGGLGMFVQPKSEQKEAAEEPVPSENDGQPGNRRFCPECGAKVAADAEWCSTCGHVLTAE